MGTARDTRAHRLERAAQARGGGILRQSEIVGVARPHQFHAVCFHNEIEKAHEVGGMSRAVLPDAEHAEPERGAGGRGVAHRV